MSRCRCVAVWSIYFRSFMPIRSGILAGTIRKIERVAEAAICGRNCYPIPRGHPTQTDECAVDERPDPGLFKLFPASCLLDKFRIASAEIQKICLLEDKSPGFDPILLV